MPISFIPGEPNSRSNASQCVFLKDRRILCYCSGNNLIVLDLTNNNIQTFYLPQDGTCVAVERSSGRIAVGFGLNVWILTLDEPNGDLARTHWSETACLRLTSRCNALSWASSTELMCGSNSLSFWNVNDNSKVWEKELANPVYYLAFSPNSELVASVGQYDHLVKLWRRTSFDNNNVSFDFSYLSHPARLTILRWQQPAYWGETVPDTLYTCCADGKIRIWTLYDSSSSSSLPSYSDCTDFRPKSVIDIGPHCVPFFLDSGEMTMATEASVEASRGTDMMSPDLQRLIDLGVTSPDLIFSLNLTNQSLSVYALDIASGVVDTIVSSSPVSITRGNVLLSTSSSSHFIDPSLQVADEPPVRIYAYPPKAQSGDNNIKLLVHGSAQKAIAQFNVNFPNLLSPSAEKKVFVLDNYFTGHSKSVQKISRSADGTRLFTQSRFADNGLWQPWALPSGVILRKVSSIDTQIPVIVAAICSNSDDGREYVVTLLRNGHLKLWDCRDSIAEECDYLDTKTVAEPMCMFFLPEGDHDHGHLLIVYSSQDIRAYSVVINQRKLLFLGDCPLPLSSEASKSIHLVRPVDPMGWEMTVGNALDLFQRSVMITVDHSGTLTNWTSRVGKDHNVDWLQVSQVDTGEKDIIRAQVSSTKKIAIACAGGAKLAIWDTENGILEYEETFNQSEDKNSISDLDWTSSSGNQCVLGVGFTKQVSLYCQLRYDYTNDRPSWAPLRTVDISQYTDHDIGDSIWLKNGTFVVGVGNQLILQDEKVDINDATTRALLESRYTAQAVQNRTIFDVCAVMNGPLPLYHPQLLIQLLFANKFAAVRVIIRRLVEKLRYATILEPSFIAEIDSNLGLTLADLLQQHSTSSNHSTTSERNGGESEDDENDTTDSLYEELSHKFQTVSLPYLTRHQQITLATVVEALAQLRSQSNYLDANGLKFLLGHKLFRMHRDTQPSMTFRDFSWAMHSENKDLLFEKSLPGQFLWPAAREVGIAFWLSEEKLKLHFESVGRNYFSQKRDPVQCALYYFALGKKQVLLGLWKVCAGHKEQQKTIKLLSNDFTLPRYKSVALKNAYALLSKHRYEYAAAFFLLADRPRDSIDVIMRYLDDLALAVAVARVYSGDKGADLVHICDKYILPSVGHKYDRWTLSWVYWTMGDRARSVIALTGGDCGNEELNSFLKQDCALRVLYEYLRDKLRIKARHEYKFLLRTAAIYSRMGCDWLALNMLMSWQFKNYDDAEDIIASRDEVSVRQETPSVVDSADMPEVLAASNDENDSTEELERMKSIQEKLKPPSQQAFQEPDMSAFSFGF